MVIFPIYVRKGEIASNYGIMYVNLCSLKVMWGTIRMERIFDSYSKFKKNSHYSNQNFAAI